MYETFEDIEALLGAESESHELEFKRGDELDAIDQNKTKEELVRDVSAFANAGGGTIIYGIEEDKGSPARAAAIHPVSNEKVTDLRLTQIIRTGLEPVFSKFSVRQIDVPTGGYIFVIAVERADTAHQCKADQKYYHRVGMHRPAMYDYEIRDVMNRRTSPIVRVYYKLIQIETSSECHVYIFAPILVNEGGRTARHWVLEVIVPNIAKLDSQIHHLIKPKGELDGTPPRLVFEYACDRTVSDRPAILLPGQSLSLSGGHYAYLRLKVTKDTYQELEKARPAIVMRMYVDDCRMEKTVIKFDDWCSF